MTLPQWGLTLGCGKAVPADVRRAGIRAHHVTAAPEGTEDAFPCAVERVIQDVFTTIVLLRPEGAASGCPPAADGAGTGRLAGGEPDKSRLTVSVPPEAILLLES